jgi:putative spermidine/putrescine transport system permease protein
MAAPDRPEAGPQQTASQHWKSISMEPQHRPFFGLFVTPAVLAGALFAAAMVAVLQYSIHEPIPGSLSVGALTLDNFAAMLHPLYGRVFIDTLWICAVTAGVSLVLAYPLAYALVRAHSLTIKSVILVITLTPLFLGEVVRTYSWITVLGNAGFINSLLLASHLAAQPVQLLFTTTGVVIALVHVTLPIVTVMLAAAIAHIDPDYEKAASSLGAGPVRVFLTVTLPLSGPGIVAALATAFAWTFSAFATPQLVGGGKVNMISNLVYQLGFGNFNFPFAASLSVAGLALTFGSLVLMRAVLRPLEKIETH